MKNINDSVFFNKILQKIKRGDFDEHFNIPFMSKDLLISSIKGKLLKKMSTNATPILSDSEINDCILEARETALYIFALYLKNGFIEKTEKGFEFTSKGYDAIKTAYKL